MRSLSFAFAIALVACGWDTYDPRKQAVVNTGGSAPGGEGGEAGGAGGEGGSVGGAGGAAPLTCGGINLIGETFDDTPNAQLWNTYTSSSGTITAGAGNQTFSVQSSTASNTEFTTHHFHDLSDGSVAIELSSATLTAPATAHFWVGPDHNNHARWSLAGATLQAVYEVDGAGQTLLTAPYDAAAHRWWRIREAGGVMYWETSADGSSYSAFAEWPSTGLFPMDQVRTRVQLHASGTEPLTPQSIVLETIAVDGPGTGWCAIGQLADTFDDGFRSREWLHTGGTAGAGSLELDGHVQFTLLSGTPNDYQYISSKNYDLTDGALSVELVEHGDGLESYVELTRTGQKVQFRVIDVDDGMGNITTELQAITDIDGNVEDRGTAPYVPAQHRFLRVRHDGTGLVWETSEDGATFDEFATVSPTPPGLVISDLDVRFGARAGMLDAPGYSRFDNLNVTP